MSETALRNGTVVPPIVPPDFCRQPERLTAMVVTIVSGVVAVLVCAEILELIFAPKKSAEHSRRIKIAVFVGALITSIVDLVLAGLTLRCAIPTTPVKFLAVDFAVLFVGRGLSVAFSFAAMWTHPKLVEEMRKVANATMLEEMVLSRVGEYAEPHHNDMVRTLRNGRGTRRRQNRSTETER